MLDKLKRQARALLMFIFLAIAIPFFYWLLGVLWFNAHSRCTDRGDGAQGAADGPALLRL